MGPRTGSRSAAEHDGRAGGGDIGHGRDPFVDGLRALRVAFHRQKEALDSFHQIPWLTWPMLRVVVRLPAGSRGLKCVPGRIGGGIQPQKDTLCPKDELATELYTSCRSRRRGTGTPPPGSPSG